MEGKENGQESYGRHPSGCLFLHAEGSSIIRQRRTKEPAILHAVRSGIASIERIRRIV
jgi:hypothetical protein